MSQQLRMTKVCHPAYQWREDFVKQALDVCQENKDLPGAGAIFGQLNQEHICFFGYDFRDRSSQSPLPGSSIEKAIVLNCSLAVQVHQLISETLIQG
ncbi:MAG: hypothetical protein Q7S87_09805 [Agitococcus sp.]|nr:hypothetical protein [Agitococcus sp.]MDO9177091.1 hypothetical protein [Agitococcus sp.]